MNKIIAREVNPEYADFRYVFDDDGLKEAGGDYCYTLFIVGQSRNVGSFNEKEYKEVKNEIENLLEMYTEIKNKTIYAEYFSIGDMLLNHKLINNIHNTKRIKLFIEFFEDCCKKPASPYGNYYNNFEAHTEEKIAQYLTYKTGKEWSVHNEYGYCQGDHVKVVYCNEHYKDGVEYYGKMWLGCGTEFCIDDTYGYYVTDTIRWTEDERLVNTLADYACCKPEELEVQLYKGSHSVDNYETLTL